MYRLLLILFINICIISCTPLQLPQYEVWHVITIEDEFTDVSTKIVTVAGGTPLHLYPFIGIREGELFVGIRSGGKIKVPTGQVQIRIDNNKTWSISPEETPLHYIPQQSLKINQNIELQENIYEQMVRMMSPFTAAIGDKAKAIVKEMLSGKEIIYRSIGFNQSGSTGRYPIDESFYKAMRQIGITPNSFN